jgi:hypothetical protein
VWGNNTININKKKIGIKFINLMNRGQLASLVWENIYMNGIRNRQRNLLEKFVREIKVSLGLGS